MKIQDISIKLSSTLILFDPPDLPGNRLQFPEIISQVIQMLEKMLWLVFICVTAQAYGQSVGRVVKIDRTAITTSKESLHGFSQDLEYE